MAEKTKSPKSAKAKAPKPAAAKAAHTPKTGKTTKAANAPKATKGSVKAVKAAARTKSKPQSIETPSIETPSIETPSVETHVETFHVVLAPLPTLIHAAKPHASEQAMEFSSFADAKERAIDHLIELIEEAERRLHLLRRATSHEEGRH